MLGSEHMKSQHAQTHFSPNQTEYIFFTQTLSVSESEHSKRNKLKTEHKPQTSCWQTFGIYH